MDIADGGADQCRFRFSIRNYVAGALRDQKRALIVGERSFGQGFRAKHNSACRWFGPQADSCPLLYPNGSSIQAEGIVPDLEVVFEPPRQDDKDNPPHAFARAGF